MAAPYKNTSTNTQTTDVFQIISEDPEELYQQWDALDQAWIEPHKNEHSIATDIQELGHTACRMALGVEILGIHVSISPDSQLLLLEATKFILSGRNATRTF